MTHSRSLIHHSTLERPGRWARIRASVERVFAPGYSYCFRCRRPWKFVDEHFTQYTETNGCFPLCEDCWTYLRTPERRLPYYRHLHAAWGRSRLDHRWEDIERAVMEGK